jgi:hypothetical protein
MAPAIVAPPPEALELNDETGHPLGRVSRPMGPVIGPGARTVYLDRKSNFR